MAISKVILDGVTKIDVTGNTADASKTLSSYIGIAADGVQYTGNVTSKSAQTYTPTTSNQTISSGQYLSGTQTILGDANLLAENIKENVTIFGVTGSLSGESLPPANGEDF